MLNETLLHMYFLSFLCKQALTFILFCTPPPGWVLKPAKKSDFIFRGHMLRQ